MKQGHTSKKICAPLGIDPKILRLQIRVIIGLSILSNGEGRVPLLAYSTSSCFLLAFLFFLFLSLHLSSWQAWLFSNPFYNAMVRHFFQKKKKEIVKKKSLHNENIVNP